MSNHKLRADKECENCGYMVDVAYCSNCGQKNVETRQSFWNLITHFAEDFTHYDGAFWRTIKYLLFRPAKLTVEYLQGYRQKYVAPVKLYIFISFITFFIISLTADYEVIPDKPFISFEEDGSIVEFENQGNTNNFEYDFENGTIAHSVKEADSLRALPKGQRIDFFEYKTAHALLTLYENKVTNVQISEIFIHTLPKVLFLYMPVFAFWLWLFHGKKRWYFYDHGIFTLHYFSFLLLLFTILRVVIRLFKMCGVKVTPYILIIFSVYTFFYFFKAHRKMYNESMLVSNTKGFILFVINMICITLAMFITIIYIILSIH